MPTKTDRILSYLPGTLQTFPRPPVLYTVADTFGNELLLAENSLSAVMLSHWVDFADKGVANIDDLARIAALYGLAPRDDETVEEFREHLKHYVHTFLDGTVTVQGILRITAEVLGLHIADSYDDLDSWWQRPDAELVTVEARGDDAGSLVLGVAAFKTSGSEARPAQVRGKIALSGLELPDPSILHLRLDGGKTTDINLPPGPVEPIAIQDVINKAMGQAVASIEAGVLVLTSPTLGASSRLEVPAGSNDAARAVLGVVPRIYQGGDTVGAQIAGKADLSGGVDLSKNRYLRLAVDGTHFAEVDCADPQAASTTGLKHVSQAINSALGINVGSDDGKHLVLQSPTKGFASSIALQKATAQDAMAILVGAVAPVQTGRDAQPARFTGSVDLSQGVDLSEASNIRLRINGTARTIDCAGFNPAQTQTLEIVTAINAAFGAPVASPDGTGIAVASRTIGPAGELAFESPPSRDATETIFGIGPRVFQGSDATSARIIGTPDLNSDSHPGVDLAAQHWLLLAVDGGPVLKIDLRPKSGDFRAVKPEQLAAVINQVAQASIASTDGHHLVLTSPTTGSGSSLEVKPLELTKRRRFVTRTLVTDEAAQAVFGFVSKQAQGTAATAAQLVGTPDLSYGVDLRDTPYLCITLDNGVSQEINCTGARPRATQLVDIVKAINAKFGDVASDDEKHIILTSPSSGAGSRIVIEPPTTSDSADALPVLGFTAGTTRGQDAARVTFTGLVDLSAGLDLEATASVNLLVDGNQHEINLASAGAVRRTAGEIAALINVEFESNVCLAVGTRLVLSSSIRGSQSQIGFKAPTGPDATARIFGLTPERTYHGDDAQSARIEGAQDLSNKVDLSVARILRLSVNGGAARDIKCAAQAATPGAATLSEIVNSVNAAVPGTASASVDGKHLVLTSPTAGFASSLQLATRPAGDASQKIFGTLDPTEQGQDAGPAIIIGTAAMTRPVDLSKRRIVRLVVSGNRPVDIDVAVKSPNATSLDEVVTAINGVFPGMAAATPDDKLQLTAPSAPGGRSIAVLPLRYLELIEYPPQPVESDPTPLRPGGKWSLTNTGASESTLEICFTTSNGVVDPALVNLTSSRSVRLQVALDTGDAVCISRDQEQGIRAEVTSADGKRRSLPADKILAGTLSSSATVPFQEPRRLTQDVGGIATLQLNNPEASRAVVLRTRQEVSGKKILVTVSESDISNIVAPTAVASGTAERRTGRISAGAGGFRLTDHAGQAIAQLRAGPKVDFETHRDRVVSVTGLERAGNPPLMIAQSVVRLFDVTLHLVDADGSDKTETYQRVTIGNGPEESSLAFGINAGSNFKGFSKLVKAEELDKGEVLVFPQGTSNWVYMECEGPQYDQARFYDPQDLNNSLDDVQYRFPGKYCDQVGIFDVSRFACRSSKRIDPVAPLFGPLAATPDPTVQVTARWMNYQPGSFVVNLPEDLDERFGGRFNQAFLASKKDSAEAYTGVVAEPDGDTNNLVKRIAALPSKFVTAQKVDRVPLGWSPVAMPFRKPQPLTRNSADDLARIYLTEEELDGAIELTAMNPGAWGDHIAVSARKSGPATYDVAIFFKGALFESARQVVRGPFPELASGLIKPGPIGVLQAKAAGVLADVTRNRAARLVQEESSSPSPLPAISYLEFDGEQSYVEVPNSDKFSISTTGGLTISAWIRPDMLKFPHVDGSGYVHWLGVGEGSGSTGQQEWAFRMYSQGNSENRENRISFYVFAPQGGEGIGSHFQDPVVVGQWIHVVGIADNETTSIYKNGVFRKCDQYRGTGDGTCQKYAFTITPKHGSAPLRIGHRDENSFFLGAIKRVRIWNRPLSKAEVADLYAIDKASRNGLVAEYLLNEGSGTVAHDSVGGNDGTIFSATWKSESMAVTM